MDRARGYTLLELMMVVVIIGLSVAIALPTMSAAMADQKQAEAALQVVSVYRSARATSMRLGTPTLVFAAAPGGQFWIVPAPRLPGVVSSCGAIDWVPLLPPPAAADLDLENGTGPNGETFGWDRYGIDVAFNVPGPAVCYSPLGRVYLSSGVGGPYSDLQSAAPGGALVIDVGRAFSNPRHVVIPLGSGMPRLGL